MSAVVNAITAIKGDRHRFKQTNLFNDVFAVREDYSPVQAGTEVQYRIGVTLGSQCWVPETTVLSDEDAVAKAVERTKRQVIEAIFGEFRIDIRALEKAIYDRDMENAGLLLYRMEQKMFEVTNNE